MKSVGFFSVVFFSMLAVFLVATGEVSRWFSEEDESSIRIRRLEVSPSGAAKPGINELTFDFWDPERGQKNFTIRAEFSQEDLQESKIEEMREIRLSDGRIEIPIHGGLSLQEASGDGPSRSDSELAAPGDGSAPGLDDTVRVRADAGVSEDAEVSEDVGAQDAESQVFVLTFDSALYHNGRTDGGGTRVALRHGVGTATDGTKILFEELTFQEKEGQKGVYTLTSNKPVRIQNDLLDLSSSTGLDGELRNGDLETLTFRPPVQALLQRDGATPDRSPDAGPSSRLAVTSTGPLEARFRDFSSGGDLAQDGEAESSDGVAAQPRTTIRFRENVVAYTVPPDATALDLPPPRGARLECQEFLLELSTPTADSGERRLVPRRAVATWAGDRVKVYFLRGSSLYRMDAGWLEWTFPEAEEGVTFLDGEALLHDRPTVRAVDGNGLFFEAERGRIRLQDDLIAFDNVEGWMDLSPEDGGLLPSSGRRQFQPPEDATTSGFLDRGGETNTPRSDGRASDEALARLWDVRAPEVQLRFSAPKTGGAKELSSLVARSPEPDGVIIESRQSLNADLEPAKQVRVTATEFVYEEDGKAAVFSGSAEGKPRFSFGESWIEAVRAELLPARGEAIFDGAVEAHLPDVGEFRREPSGGTDGASAGTNGASAGTDGASAGTDGASAGTDGPAALSSSGKSIPKGFDLSTGRLEVGFQRPIDADGKEGDFEVLHLHALGSSSRETDGEVVIRSTVAQVDEAPRFTFYGREVYWQTVEGKAWFYGEPVDSKARVDSEARGGVEAGPQLATLEVDGGVLQSEQIRFDHKTWKALFTESVTLRTSREGDSDGGVGKDLRIVTGRAEVGFFENFKDGPGPKEGLLEDLRMVRSVHALSGPDSPIQVEGKGFHARAIEATWEASNRELRLHGDGVQEIEILQDAFSGPLRAEEIVYQEALDRVLLRRAVQGEFTQATAPGGSGPFSDAQLQPAAHGERNSQEPLTWHFQTDNVEVQMRRVGPGSSRLELVSLRAHDDVRIRELTRGLLFHGDEFDYTAAQRKIHIYSRDSRSQTLTHQVPALPVVEGEHAPVARQDKIQSEEIWVVLTPEDRGGASGPASESRLYVDFVGTVTAVVHLAPSKVQEFPGMGTRLRLTSDRLTVDIHPADDSEGGYLVRGARASGDVSFLSGDYKATSETATYDRGRDQLVLLGAGRTPVRLFQREELLREDDHRIVLEHSGSTWRVRLDR